MPIDDPRDLARRAIAAAEAKQTDAKVARMLEQFVRQHGSFDDARFAAIIESVFSYVTAPDHPRRAEFLSRLDAGAQLRVRPDGDDLELTLSGDDGPVEVLARFPAAMVLSRPEG